MDLTKGGVGGVELFFLERSSPKQALNRKQLVLGSTYIHCTRIYTKLADQKKFKSKTNVMMRH